MSGHTVRILPRTDYTMTGLAAGSSATVVIARRIDTSAWREGVVLVRLHQATWPAAATITLLQAVDGYTDEDPGQIWTVTTSTLVTFSKTTDTPPIVKIAELSVPFGPLMQLQLQFSTGGNTGTFTPSLSVDLDLKGD
jgi:hypothetical protein